jgi:hypothetical protein
MNTTTPGINYPPKQSFNIQDREDGIATTALTNELAAAVRALQPHIHTGQVVDDHPWGGASIGLGEFQWQDYTMVSANQPGWDDDRFSAVLEDG